MCVCVLQAVGRTSLLRAFYGRRDVVLRAVFFFAGNACCGLAELELEVVSSVESNILFKIVHRGLGVSRATTHFRPWHHSAIIMGNRLGLGWEDYCKVLSQQSATNYPDPSLLVLGSVKIAPLGHKP